MPIDPRTPVLVGVGQVTHRPDPLDATTRTDPLALMCAALERAGEDAAAIPGSRTTLLDHVDELTAIPSFVWHVPDPGRAVADASGVRTSATVLANVGGTGPQRAVLDASSRILAGELGVAVVVGAEAMKSRDVARKHDEQLAWPVQDADTPPAAVRYPVPDALTDHERSLGLALPVHSYALFEHALRRSLGRSKEAHTTAVGALAARMSAVAATNEHAWFREPITAAQATTPSPSNRMVSAPYTKLLTSNVVVDMGAAAILTSLGAARDAGVPEDRLVFPLAGVVAYEQWLISQRQELSQSLAMRACARALFGPSTPSDDDLGLIELYSCFPVVVEMACAALGIDPVADERAPSVTGGMTFFGGPGNNFTTHSLASMVGRLRQAPGTTGLVTSLGWYASTHAWATYSTAPPRDGFVIHDVQSSIDAEPLRKQDDAYEGSGDVESYAVGVDRTGAAARAIVSVLTPGDARRLVATDDPGLAAEVLDADPLSAQVSVTGSTFTLR